MAKGKPVTGTVKAGAAIKSHWDGWNAALDVALKETGWKPKTYKDVKVDFYVNIEVVNPGSIVEYAVKLTPGG
jgi:hypothetical protein